MTLLVATAKAVGGGAKPGHDTGVTPWVGITRALPRRHDIAADDRRGGQRRPLTGPAITAENGQTERRATG